LLYNTEAIVVRSIAYGESDAIVTLLTPSGLVAALARGAKKPRSRLTAGVRLCVEGVYSIYSRSGMGTIQQFELMQSRRTLHEQLDKAAYAAYFCELILAAAGENEVGSSAVYLLFQGILNRLRDAATDDCRTVARIWETKVLSLLGVAPEWRRCVDCGEWMEQSAAYYNGGLICSDCFQLAGNRYPVSRVVRVPSSTALVLSQFARVPLDKIGNVSLSEVTQIALKNVLLTQMTEYAGLRLKSRSFLDMLDELQI